MDHFGDEPPEALVEQQSRHLESLHITPDRPHQLDLLDSNEFALYSAWIARLHQLGFYSPKQQSAILAMRQAYYSRYDY